MAVVMGMQVERHLLTGLVSLCGQFLHALLYGPCGCLRVGSLYLRVEEVCLRIQRLAVESQYVLLQLPGRSTFFPTSQDTPHRNDWLCRQFNAAWYRNNTARATAYDLRHHYVTANIYSWRGQGIGYGLTDRLLALSKSLGHAGIASTLYYFSLVPAFEGEMADELEAALERLAEDTVI
jgi:hypothetical protein